MDELINLLKAPVPGAVALVIVEKSEGGGADSTFAHQGSHGTGMHIGGGSSSTRSVYFEVGWQAGPQQPFQHVVVRENTQQTLMDILPPACVAAKQLGLPVDLFLEDRSSRRIEPWRAPPGPDAEAWLPIGRWKIVRDPAFHMVHEQKERAPLWACVIFAPLLVVVLMVFSPILVPVLLLSRKIARAFFFTLRQLTTGAPAHWSFSIGDGRLSARLEEAVQETLDSPLQEVLHIFPLGKIQKLCIVTARKAVHWRMPMASGMPPDQRDAEAAVLADVLLAELARAAS
jgi:hypothetical protein